MKPIISSRSKKANHKLRAKQFYPEWAGKRMPYTGSPATIYRRTMEFAEAYADERVAHALLTSLDLFCRAAELLRSEPYNRDDQRKWRRQRNRWLRDVGMETGDHPRS